MIRYARKSEPKRTQSQKAAFFFCVLAASGFLILFPLAGCVNMGEGGARTMIEQQTMIPGAETIIEQGDREKYEQFTDKFKPKLTTDDCYTPEPVYEAVADWVANEYGVDKSGFVRPFWPGADYQAQEYSDGCTVVDNPPFSLFAQIMRFYQQKGIKFFLFGPSLTLYAGRGIEGVCYISSDSDITYANGATVKTGFATNLDRHRLRSAPTLYRAVKAANDAVQKQNKKEFPKYTYPDYVCTSAMVQRYSHYGVDFRVLPEDCTFIPAMDAQRAVGKSIFGGGYLLSERAAAERAAAERAAAERAAAERAAAQRWTLSARELNMVQAMSGGGTNAGSETFETIRGQMTIDDLE